MIDSKAKASLERHEKESSLSCITKQNHSHSHSVLYSEFRVVDAKIRHTKNALYLDV